MKPLIAVSGKNGQLGWELEQLSVNNNEFSFLFCDRSTLDITNSTEVSDFFNKHQPAVFINTAAYTAVDKAEVDREKAYKTNAEAVRTLAGQCKKHNTLFITFSTDYVFAGDADKPYKEYDTTDPVNYYGYTKAAGEQFALNEWERTIIIRTSWVYSIHGNNFVKTMLRLMKERTDINVVNDQVGAPTYAKDLAQLIMRIAANLYATPTMDTRYGIYHYCNKGIISWFDFASEIRELSGLKCTIHGIPTSGYPTPAKRPAYSVLDTGRIEKNFNIELKDWTKSLAGCIEDIKQKGGS